MTTRPDLADFVVCLPKLPPYAYSWINAITRSSSLHFVPSMYERGDLLEQGAGFLTNGTVSIISPCKGVITYVSGETWSGKITTDAIIRGTFDDQDTLIKIRPLSGYPSGGDYAKHAFGGIVSYHDSTYGRGWLSKSLALSSSTRAIVYAKMADKSKFEAEEAKYLEQIESLRRAGTRIERVAN